MRCSLKTLCAAAATLAILAGTVGTANHALGQGVVPNDPAFVRQWGMHVTDAALAWNVSTGSMRVRVAIVDAGVDFTHPDLYLNIWLNQEEIPPAVDAQLIDVDGDDLITFRDLNAPVNQAADTISDLNGNGYIDGGDVLRPVAQGGWADGLDNGGNGFADDLVGWDFIDGDNDPQESADERVDAHGTAVAGIIGAVGNNSIGVAGINWQVQLMPLRVNAGEDPTPAVLLARMLASIEAVAYAIDNGARVGNFSSGAPSEFVPAEIVAATEALLDAAAEHDVLFVTSAGNDGVDTDLGGFFPSSLPHDNIISVAATFRQQDRLADFGNYWASNYGATSVDLGAPGDYLWTTGPTSLPGEPYVPFGGTSAAAPYVAGAAALILSVDPDLRAAEVKSLLLDSVDPVEDLQGTTVSGGRLNVARAVLGAILP